MYDPADFIRLNQARKKWEETRAAVASELAEVARRWRNSGIGDNPDIARRFNAIAKSISVEWDDDAYKHLLDMRDVALRAAAEEARATVSVKRWSGLLHHLNSYSKWRGRGKALLVSSWAAFHGIREYVAPHVKLDNKDTFGWRDWDDNEMGPAENPEGARVRCLYAVVGSPAATLIASVLEKLSDLAGNEASEIEVEIDAVRKEAAELAKIDWNSVR